MILKKPNCAHVATN